MITDYTLPDHNRKKVLSQTHSYIDPTAVFTDFQGIRGIFNLI